MIISAPDLSGGMTLVKPQIGIDASQVDDNAPVRGNRGQLLSMGRPCARPRCPRTADRGGKPDHVGESDDAEC